ncbi:Ral GTPase-activating protein subunit alpha-2 [Choanephora cucurbitarum]|uniref:Ral GTPase-activating protein subunit alpha-2 n=1 Tax=Choanephora cucurbitarum TaxID=101091 RepID=A0A1C7NQJ4_9FUNG|nr:Ral GTPase-activating protein subunit alpha-2 [Choanephora cucurbitarum]
MRKAIPSSSLKKGLVHTTDKPSLPPNIILNQHTETNLDVPILPSNSTFTLSSKEDKNEKLKKKAKNFLDERQKTKSRAQSLWSFIDATNTFDQARFFQENAEQVFQVVFDTCMHQIEKIKHKSERPQSWNSKELVGLQKTLLLLRKIFLYVPELMRNGWQRSNIAIILTHILDHGNHPRLRALGFQLLLLWLNDQVVEYPECMNLFANAISLDLFVLDDIQPYGPSTSTNTSNTNQAPVAPAPMHATTHLSSPTQIHDMDEAATNTASNKLHTGGLQFVKKLRESHANPDRQVNHGLSRSDKIKSSPIQLNQRLILGDDTPSLYPNPSQPTFNDSIVLIHIFISNLVRLAYVAAGSPPPPDEYDYPPGDHFEPDDGIATGVGIDAATASAKFLFKIFRTCYMTKFVPLISKSLSVEGSLKTGICGFPSCPPSILRSLLKFLIGYCLDNDSHHANLHWPQTSHASGAATAVSSPATPILKSIVLSSHETREMLHEIIRQSLVLPCTNPQYRDITRGAIHILGVWILGNEDERPSFLRRSGSVVTRSSSTASVSNNSISNDPILSSSSSSRVFSSSPVEEYAPQLPLKNTTMNEDYSDANTFLRRYLLMIKLVFEDRRQDATQQSNRDVQAFNAQQVADWEGLVALYKDAISVYRSITVSKGGIDIEWESWELLLQCLLDIQQWFMSQPEKYSRIPVQSLAEELADYIWETLFHAFIRAKITHMELWHHLKTHLGSSMRWPQSLNQWVRIMQKLTRLLSSRLYKVDYELYPDTKHRLVEEFPSNNTNTSGTTGRSNNNNTNSGASIHSRGGNSSRSKSKTRHNNIQERQMLESTPEPEGSMSNLLRNLSSASLSDIANPFKTDRKSASLALVVDEELEDAHIDYGVTNTVKFGIKNIKPANSSSNTPSHASSGHNTHNASTVQPSSASIGKRGNTFHSSTNNSSTNNTNGHVLRGRSGSINSNAGNNATLNHTATSDKSTGRRTISIQQLDTLWQDSGSKLLNFVHHGDNTQPTIVKSSAKDDDKKNTLEWDHASASSIEEISTKSNRTSSSSAWPAGESLSVMANPAAVSEKLPVSLGSFRSPEFLVLNNVSYDGLQVLSIWKNMLLTIGNINAIERPRNHVIAIQCVVEIWDTLCLVRAQQPYRDIPIPAMYEVAPWLFQATELPESFNAGKAVAYGSLCRLMSQRPEEKVPEGYYAAFYKCILEGLASENNTIIHSILINSERLFGSCLPGVHILIPSFIDTIEKQLLNDSIPHNVSPMVKKSCIVILGSLVSISNHLKDVSIDTSNLDLDWIEGIQGNQFNFADVKLWLKNIFIRLVSSEAASPQPEEDVDLRCMLLGALSALAMDEMLTPENPLQEFVHECILSLVNHLYWSNLSVVNTVSDCLVAMAHIYREDLDKEGVIVQEILTRIIDSLNVHLKYYEQNTKCGRGFVISKLFSCLLEWIMSIEPTILTETDLCQLVFDVIELALHVTSDDNEKRLPHPPRTGDTKKKETPFKFKLMSDKRPTLHEDIPAAATATHSSETSENDQSYVKESAEAILLHLLHHFNNFAPPYGPSIIHSTIVGPGVSQDDLGYHEYQYFSFNDTTIIAFVELPKSEERGVQARIIIRDLTGRYVWDTQIESPDKPLLQAQEEKAIVDSEQEFSLRDNIAIRQQTIPDEIEHKGLLSNQQKEEEDPMKALLKQIGDSHPDCLLDPNLPLDVPSTSTPLQLEMLKDLDNQLNDYLQNESENNNQQKSDIQLWYSKMNALRKKETPEENKVLEKGDTSSLQSYLISNFSLRKDFLPAFPLEAEKPNVPFQQSRLLMSHMGLIHYKHLKDGSFQMLNKTPALYRDLRGLDRKHGRETMKIGLIYVAHGQEDEQSILQNSRGSERYNAFVNSLGWEIDIATHTGYLGGLERNLTNGSRATYYCSSTIEMIFHDVTKMPTDTSDPKQLKKKRHIGNDHVHIVWNEHDRDYRIDTIGGDFGDAQIIVTPLPNSLYSIQVYRDPKVSWDDFENGKFQK